MHYALKKQEPHARSAGILFQIIGRGPSVETRPVFSIAMSVLSVEGVEVVCLAAAGSFRAVPLRLWTALKVFSAGRRHLCLGTCAFGIPKLFYPGFPNLDPPKLQNLPLLCGLEEDEAGTPNR